MVLSVLVAMVLIQRLLASLSRELGGEPRAARQMMRRVADGDLTVHIQAPAGSLLATLDDMVQALRALLETIDKQAVELALETGPPGKFSVEHVVNVLGRLNAQPAPPTAASHLKTTTPPLADTARYDRLRADSAPADATATEGAGHEA